MNSLEKSMNKCRIKGSNSSQPSTRPVSSCYSSEREEARKMWRAPQWGTTQQRSACQRTDSTSCINREYRSSRDSSSYNLLPSSKTAHSGQNSQLRSLQEAGKTVCSKGCTSTHSTNSTSPSFNSKKSLRISTRIRGN